MLSGGFMVPTPQYRQIASCKSHSASHRLLFCKPYCIHTPSMRWWTSFLCWRICCLHSTQMFVSSYYCTPCRSWGCYKYFTLHFVSKRSFNMCFHNLFFFSVSALLFGTFPLGGEDKVKPLLCSIRSKRGVFFFWMRQQKGLNWKVNFSLKWDTFLQEDLNKIGIS